MSLVGHSQVRGILENFFPPATLIVGPASVGKRTLAAHLAEFHGAGFSDILDIECLTMPDARALPVHFGRRPVGKVRVAIVGLDGASGPSQHAILKVVEETPPSCHVLLLASSTSAVLLSVASRCFRVYLGRLRREEVVQVLCNQGWSPREAAVAAERSGGTMAGALQIQERERVRSQVLPILVAMTSQDPALALNATEVLWDAQEGPAVLHGLQRWVQEAWTGRWQYFSSEDGAEIVRRGSLRAIEGALASGARPVLAVRAAIVAARQGR